MTSDKGSLLITNGNVITMDESRPRAACVLITDGRITKVGSFEELAPLGDQAEILDVQGASVLPGFVDAHTHFELTSVSLDRYLNAHTPPCRSLADIADVISTERERCADYPWIVCRSSFGLQNKVSDRRLFTRDELDRLVSDKPLVVFAGLHVSMLNSAALVALDLLDGEVPPGSTLHRDANGQPNGTVTDVFDRLPAWPVELIASSVAAHEADVLLANGICSVSSIPFSGQEMRAVRLAQRRGELSVRVRHYPVYPWGASLESFEQLGVDSDFGDDHYRIGGLKIFVDGQGSDGLDHLFDDLKYSQEELDEAVDRADELGLQVLMHAFTRTGIKMAASATARLARKRPARDRRHRIEHGADYINLEDLDEVRASGVGLVTTPHFMYSGAAEIAPRTPLRSLIDAGFRPIGGTDTTGTVPESGSPLFNIACAVTRRQHDGSRLRPEQAVTVLEGLKMFTTWAAYGGFEEDRKGKLAPGYLADVIVLSSDPLSTPAEELRAITVDATIIGGKIVALEVTRLAGLTRHA